MLLGEDRAVEVPRVVVHAEDCRRPVRSAGARGTSESNALAWKTRASGISSATSWARSRSASTSRTRSPWPRGREPIVVPMRPAPKITMSSTLRCSCASLRLQSRADFGEAITTTRSLRLDLLVAAAGRSCGRRGSAWPPCSLPAARACRSGQPISASSDASAGTSNSTTCTLPSAKDVGLARRGEADDAGDRVSGLQLGRDHEVDVDLALPPGLQQLHARRADDRLGRRRGAWPASRRPGWPPRADCRRAGDPLARRPPCGRPRAWSRRPARS